MKNTSTLVLCTIFSCITILTYAQENGQRVPLNEPNLNKPKLFQNLPEKIAVDVSALESFFGFSVGQPASVSFGDIQFKGNILSKSNESPTQNNTVILSLNNYPGANFTLTKINNPDGSINYVGRVVSFQHGDLLELQNQKGNWQLVKRNFYDLINE